MGFIRVKKISGKPYAYLVKNKWRKRLKGGKKGSRQKVSKYLGKVIRIEKIMEKSFFEFVDIKNKPDYLESSKEKIVMDLVRYELETRGFSKDIGMMKNGNYSFSVQRKKFLDDDGNEEKIVVEMNEGYLCNYTIKSLIEFKANSDDEHVIGIELAKAFLEAGLNVPKEVFIGYFEKI